MIQTRDQKFANAAVKCATRRAGDKDYKNYRTDALGFPSLVMQAGLAQALGFLAAKKKNGLLDDLADVLDAGTGSGFRKGEVLQERSRVCELREYRQLTRDVLAASAWLKRCTQATEK